MSFTFKGKLVSAEEPRTLNNGAVTRAFTVQEDKDEYPQKGKFSIYKKEDQAQWITDKFPAIGSMVEVEFNLKLVEGTSKKTGNPYSIQDLSVWKLTTLGGEQAAPQQSSNDPFGEDSEDLPF